MKEMKAFIIRYRYEIILMLIIAIAIFLRFYNVPGRYTFDYDATGDAIVAHRSVEELQLPLTGNFSSAGAFTFGPWYYYHLIAFYFLTRLPYSVWLFNGILSVLTVVTLYQIGRSLKDKMFGMILAFLAAISPAQIAIASSSSNPNLVVFYTALTILFFIRLLKEKQHPMIPILLGMSVGIAINAHYQAFPLLFFPLMLVFFSQKNRVSAFILSGVGVFITFLPLLFFNLTNHWHTVQNFFYYSLHGKDLVYVPNSWTIYIRDFWPEVIAEFFGLPSGMGILFILSMIGIYAYLLLTKKLPKFYLILSVFLALTFLYLRYYWGERHFVYLYFLHPVFYLLIGYVLYFVTTRKKGLYIVVALLSVLMIFGIHKAADKMQQKNYSLYEEQAKEIMRLYPDRSVTIYLCKGRDFSRGSALSYFLDREMKNGKNGPVRLALYNSGCLKPKNALVREKPASREAVLLEKIYPKLSVLHAFDFSSASNAAIVSEGWEALHTEAIYDSEVRWWFTEQP